MLFNMRAREIRLECPIPPQIMWQAKHLAKCRRDNSSKDGELQRRQQLLSSRPQDAFGVPAHVISSLNFEHACTLLANFDQATATSCVPPSMLAAWVDYRCGLRGWGRMRAPILTTA